MMAATVLTSISVTTRAQARPLSKRMCAGWKRCAGPVRVWSASRTGRGLSLRTTCSGQHDSNRRKRDCRRSPSRPCPRCPSSVRSALTVQHGSIANWSAKREPRRPMSGSVGRSARRWRADGNGSSSRILRARSRTVSSIAPNMLGLLRRRELARVGAQLSGELGLSYAEARPGDRIAGIYRRRLDLASGRFALIEKSREFTLVPWRPVLDRNLGKQVSGIMRDDSISWTLGRQRRGPSIV